MFEKLEELAKNNKKISDFHIRTGWPLAYRQTGEIHKIPDVLVKAQDLQDLLSTNCNEIEMKKFQDTHELDSSVTLSGLRFRANFYKTIQGPAAVLRRVESVIPTMDQFDLPPVLYDIIDMHKGLVLVTGPTGSGKSTSLTAFIRRIHKPERRIMTVEDPVEYEVAGINQVQVRSDVGMTFSAALRAMLRQAPNIVMVGEIRDLETAEIAINASLTGHMVFSTLHTNDAPSAVSRLVDMGVKPFLVSASLRAALAQRLVRSICQSCKEPHTPSPSELSVLGIGEDQVSNASFMRGAGCDKCGDKGFRGRKGVFEIFVVNEEIEEMIYHNVSIVELRRKAREMGMRSMREDGFRKVLAGVTTLDEVLMVTTEEE